MPISIPIVCLPLKNEIIQKIISFGCESVQQLELLMNSQTFQSSLTSEQFQEVEAFLQARKNKTYTKINGYDLYYKIGSNWRDIPTTSNPINLLLHGGLKQGTITELSGRGGMGKTQFCMMFCATVQMANTISCQYQAIYVDTENTYNALRQQEILKRMNNSYASLQNIFVWKLKELSELMQLLHLLPTFLDTHPNIRLLVIDSITYFFRKFTDMIERSVKLYEAIQCLMNIVKKYSICIIITNHVTSFTPDTPESIIGSHQVIQPLLSPLWWHSMTNQILLSMSPDGQRNCTIMKSSYLATNSSSFQITVSGIQ